MECFPEQKSRASFLLMKQSTSEVASVFHDVSCVLSTTAVVDKSMQTCSRLIPNRFISWVSSAWHPFLPSTMYTLQQSSNCIIVTSCLLICHRSEQCSRAMVILSIITWTSDHLWQTMLSVLTILLLNPCAIYHKLRTKTTWSLPHTTDKGMPLDFCSDPGISGRGIELAGVRWLFASDSSSHVAWSSTSMASFLQLLWGLSSKTTSVSKADIS